VLPATHALGSVWVLFRPTKTRLSGEMWSYGERRAGSWRGDGRADQTLGGGRSGRKTTHPHTSQTECGWQKEWRACGERHIARLLSSFGEGEQPVRPRTGQGKREAAAGRFSPKTGLMHAASFPLAGVNPPERGRVWQPGSGFAPARGISRPEAHRTTWSETGLDLPRIVLRSAPSCGARGEERK
jgi:hypothetical protein